MSVFRAYIVRKLDFKEYMMMFNLTKEDCTNDMKQSPNRNVAATLPALSFDDQQFDITLSAPSLFTYADRLDYDFHLQTIEELLRVSQQEIRIFPLVALSCNSMLKIRL